MKIGEIGQGPMEYNRNNLMTIDIRNKRIRVYSIQEKVMIEYSYDGDFLNRVHFDLPDDTFGRKQHFVQLTLGKLLGL